MGILGTVLPTHMLSEKLNWEIPKAPIFEICTCNRSKYVEHSTLRGPTGQLTKWLLLVNLAFQMVHNVSQDPQTVHLKVWKSFSQSYQGKHLQNLKVEKLLVEKDTTAVLCKNANCRGSQQYETYFLEIMTMLTIDMTARNFLLQ